MQFLRTIMMNESGCVLRYVPDETGERVNPSGMRYKKYDFEDAYAFIEHHKPQYSNLVQRIPIRDIKTIYKPDIEILHIARKHIRVQKLLDLFRLPAGTIGCTGSLLCGLENEMSDIDMVVYGRYWFIAQQRVRQGILDGQMEGLSPEMWRKVYEKRKPEIFFDQFVLHELRKWNRGQIDGTYFDILYTRSYDELKSAPTGRGTIIGKMEIEAQVTDASLAFDSPAVYEVEHESVSRVLYSPIHIAGRHLRGKPSKHAVSASGMATRTGWLLGRHVKRGGNISFQKHCWKS